MKIISKTENSRGVVITIEEEYSSFWNSLVNIFRYFAFWLPAKAKLTRQYQLFYPISEHGYHETTGLSYYDTGKAVSVGCWTQVRNLLAKAEFEAAGEFQNYSAKGSSDIDRN